ncbi:MAG: NAD-dependent epimerase/dehydratase family protein [Elusimicrobia bacterium]|nr:NAD-dependent epimerase/dehydratase family protein [Elusimicrobiota bacterium]
MRTVLVCGAAGFIGRNVLERLAGRGDVKVRAVVHKRRLPEDLAKKVEVVEADLTRAEDVARVLTGVDHVVQAAATTSGSKDIVDRPYHHVTDNAVMNSLLLRACHELGVKHLLFFSCTVMYPSAAQPVKESGFDGNITDRYFGVGWTKVYIEKMCEFYARLGKTRFTVVRHSNVYGPHDKYDLEKSHVFGATVAKVMTAKDGKVTVWGEGTEARDLLYAADLVDFVEAALELQKTPFELCNVGAGTAVSVRELVERIIARSGKTLRLEFDRTKPTIPFTLAVDAARAKQVFGWTPKTSLDDGIDKSLAWYKENV